MAESAPQSSLAVRLRAARDQAGLSQGQVAQLLKLQRPTITEIEAGRRRVTTDELKKLAEIYGVTVVWLLGENNETDPSVELAARQLARLDKGDLETVLQLLRTLKKAHK